MEENLLSNMGMGSKTTDSPYGFNTEFDKVTGTPLFGLGGEGLVPELKKDEEEKKKAEDDTLKTLSSMFDEKPEEQKDFREGVLPSASGVSEKPEAIAGSIENFDNIFKNVPYNVDVEQASLNQRREDLDKPFSEDRKVKAGNKEYVIKAGETKQDLINKLNKEQAFRSEEEKRKLIEEAKKTPKPFETPAIPRFGLEPADKQEDKREAERRSLIQDLQSGKITYANITPQQADILAGPGIKIEQDWTNKRNQIQQAIEDAKASKLAGDTAVSLINNIVPLHKLYGTELTNKMIFDAGVNAYANGLAGSKNPNGYRKAFMAGVALNAPSLIGGATSASFATGLSTVLGVNPWLRLGIGLGTFIGVEKSLSKIIDKALSYIPENSFGISKEQIEKLAKENPEAFNMGSHLAVATAFRPSLSLRNILSGSASLGGLQTVNEVVDILGDPDKKATDFNVQNVINAAMTGVFFNKAIFGARWERANTPETQTRVRNLLTELENLKKSPAEVDASGNVIPKQTRALEIKNEILKIDPFFETRLNSIFEINGEISQVGSRIQAFANKNNLTPNQLERLIKAGKLNTETGLTKEFISDVKEFNKLNRSLNQVDPSGMARRYQFFQQQPGPSGYGPGHEERWRERSEREAQGEMGMEVPGQPQAEAVATVPATTAVPALTTESMRNVSQIVDAVTPLIPEAAEPARTHEQVMTSFEPPKPTEPVVETTKPTEPAAETTKPTEPAAETVKPTEPVVEAVKPVEPLAEAVKPTEPSEPVTSGRVVNVGGQSYTLTKEQNERWQKEILPEEENIKRILEDGKRGLARGNRIQYEQSLSTSKGYSMRLSAIKRDIVGAYTAREQQAIDARAKSNYIGKPVNILVQGIRVPGKITKNVFGRVTVKLDSGESVTVSKEDVLPIDEQPKSRAVESKPILPTEQDPYKKFEELNFEVEHSNDPSPENVLELAKMYQKGIGTSQDINKARELFVMANDIDPKVGGKPLADFTTEYNQYINKRAMESKPLSPEPPTISKKNVQELDKALSDYKNGIINQDALAQIIDRVANENVLSFGETIRQLDASLSRMGETSIYRGVNAKTNIEKRTNVLAGMKRAVDMGALSKNGYDMFEFMVRNLMDESILQNLSVEISPETYKGQIGLFDPRENKVVLYFNQLEKVSELSFNQSPERTFAAVHEVSHYLSQFLPPEIKAEINKSYIKEINTKLKEVRMALERNPLDAEAKLKQDYLLSSLSAHVSPSNIADSAWDKAGDIYSEFTDNNTRNEMYQFRSPDEYAAENLASLVSQKWGNYETARKAFGKNSPQAIIAKRKLIRISKAAANQSIALSRFIIPKKVKAGRFAGKTLTRSEGQQKTDVFEKSLDYFKTKKSEEAVLNKGMMAEHFDGIKEILGKNNLQLFAEAKAAGEKIFSLERRMESKPEIRGEGEIVPFKEESYKDLINDIENQSSEIFKMALSEVRKKGLNRVGDSKDIAMSLLSEVFFPESGDTLEVKWQSGQGLVTPRGIIFKDPIDYIKHQLDLAANRSAKQNGLEVSAESMVTEEGDTGASVMDRINLENEGAVIPQDVAVVSQQGEKDAVASIKAISEATIDFLNSASERGEFFSGRQYAQSSLSERQMLSQIASNFYFLNNFNRMLSEYGIIEKQREKIIALNNARLAVDNFVNQYGNTEKFGSPEFIRSNPTIKIWLSGTNGANQLSKNTVARVIAPKLQTHLVERGLLPEVFEPKENENVLAKRYSRKGSIEEQISKLNTNSTFYHLQTTKDLIKSFTEDYRKLFESLGFKFDDKKPSKFYGLYDRTLNPNDTPDIAAFEESKRQSQKESMSARAIVRKRLDELTKQNALKLYQAKREFVTQRNVDTGRVRTLASKPLPTGEAGKDSGLVSEEKDFGVVNYEEARQRGVNLPSTNKPAGALYWGTHAASVALTLHAGFKMYQIGNPYAISNAIGIWLAGTYGLHAIRNAAISTARILKSQRSISIPKNALLPFTERIEASVNRFLQAKKDKGAANAVFDAVVKAIDNKYNLIPFNNRFKLVSIQRAANAAVHMVKVSASRLDNFVNGIEDPVIQNQVRTYIKDFLNPSNRLGPNVKDLINKWKEYQKQLKIQSDLSKNGIDVKDERYDAYIRAQQAYENALNNFKNSKNQIRQAATTNLEKFLSKELMKDLTDIRTSAVEIQNLWLSSGAIDKDTAQRIEFTLDDHIRKVYLAYRDRDAWLAQPDFAEKRKALINEIANANYSKSGSGISAPGSKADYIAEATAYVDSIINDSNWFVVNQDRVITDSFLRNAVKGLNKKNLQERMRLNKATEEFLGLIENPLVGVVDGQTIDRTALVNLQISKSLADYALKAGLAIPVSNLKNGQVPDGFVKLPLVNPEKNPFIADNVWHKSMIPVIQDLVMPGFQNPAGIIGDTLKKIIGLKKASLTVFNTSLWLSQLPSNMVLTAMHGDLLNTRFVSNISALLHGAYVKTADVFNFQPLRKMLLEGAVPGEDFERFMKLAYNYGHLSTGTTAYDVREIFKDSDTPHKLDWWMNKFGDAFSIADTAMRFQAIVSRYQQVRDEAIKRAQSGEKMLSMEEIFEIASNEVSRDYPDMAHVPQAIKTLSQFGILQPFVSFPVNIIRGTTNALVHNVKVAVGNDPIARPRAIWKLSNLLAVLTLFGSAAIDSMFDKDPEKSLDDNSIESAKMLDPENSNAASGVDWKWRDREAGVIEYRDSKQLIPNASVNNIVAYLNRYANAKTEEEKTAALKSVATQFKDFATFDPAGSIAILSLVESLAPGKTIKDGELVDRDFRYSGLNTVQRYLAAAGTSFRTADMNTLDKLLNTTNDSINLTTGKPLTAEDILSKYTTMPIRTMSVNGTVRRVTGKLNSEMNELRDDYSKEYLNTPISGMAINGMINKQKDFIKFGQAMRSTMDNAEKLGRTRESIVQAMLSAGMEEGDIASVISRDYGNIMSINKFTEKIVNNKFSKIYDNTIVGGINEQLGISLSDAFKSTWKGYFITSLVDGKSNSEKFNVVSKGNYEAKNINMIELNRKIIDNYINNASIDMSSVTKKDILNYYQDVLKYLDQFKSWEDFVEKHPDNKNLYENFLIDYYKFEQPKQHKSSLLKENRR